MVGLCAGAYLTRSGARLLSEAATRENPTQQWRVCSGKARRLHAIVAHRRRAQRRTSAPSDFWLWFLKKDPLLRAGQLGS
jgi:hypothetical protein